MNTSTAYPYVGTLPGNRLAAIPAELIERPQWVRVKLVTNGGSKPDKRPWHPTQDRAASVSDPSTWGTFAEAHSNIGSDRTAAVGYVFSVDDPYFGVDLDRHTDDNGELTPNGRRWLEAFDSYSEWSLSGRGLHIIGKGKLPRDTGKKDDVRGVEAYDHARYFVFTGAKVEGTRPTIEPRQAALDAFVNEYFPQRRLEPPKPVNGSTANGSRHDQLRSQSVKNRYAGLSPAASFAALAHVRDEELPVNGRPIPDSELWSLVNTAAAKYQAEAEPEAPIPADLSDWRSEEQIEYTIEPLLPTETLALLAAPGKTGKSLLVLYIMLWAGAALGGKLFGVLKPPTEPKRILLLDFENGPRRLRRRIRAAVQGGGITPAQAEAALANITAFCGMKYARQALDSGLLRQHIEAVRPDLIVIDPLRPMLPAGGSENDSVVVGPVLDGIRSVIQGTGASVILIDHVGHADKGRPRGSTAKLDAVDFVWNLSRDKDDVTRLIFEVTHDRDDVGVSQFGLALRKDKNSFKFERVNIGPSGLAREIVQYLDQYGPTPQPKLAKALGESASSVRDAVARLRQANQIEDDGRTDSGAKVVKVRRADGLTEGDGA